MLYISKSRWNTHHWSINILSSHNNLLEGSHKFTWTRKEGEHIYSVHNYHRLPYKDKKKSFLQILLDDKYIQSKKLLLARIIVLIIKVFSFFFRELLENLLMYNYSITKKKLWPWASWVAQEGHNKLHYNPPLLCQDQTKK